MRYNRISYSLMLFITFMFVLYYNRPIAWTALYIFILLPVFSFVTTYVSKKKLTVEQFFDREQIFKGESFDYNVEVKNTSVMYFPNVWLHYFTAKKAVLFDGVLPASTKVELLPRKSYKVSFSFSCKYCGNYDFGLSKIVIYDHLGLFRFTKNIGQNTILTVFPRVNELFDFPFESNHLSETQSSFSKRDEDYAVISDIRKYATGDSVKKVHWKLSARKNEMMVKTYQSNTISSSLFVVDTNTGKRDEIDSLIIEDSLMEDLVSALSYCCTNKFPLELYYIFKGEINMITGDDGFELLYSKTAALKFTENYNFLELLDFSVSILKENTNVICFSKSLNRKTSEMLKNIKTLGHNVVCFVYCKKNSEVEGTLDDLFKSGIFCVYKEL